MVGSKWQMVSCGSHKKLDFQLYPENSFTLSLAVKPDRPHNLSTHMDHPFSVTLAWVAGAPGRGRGSSKCMGGGVRMCTREPSAVLFVIRMLCGPCEWVVWIRIPMFVCLCRMYVLVEMYVLCFCNRTTSTLPVFNILHHHVDVLYQRLASFARTAMRCSEDSRPLCASVLQQIECTAQ